MKRFALPTVLAAAAALSVTSPARAQYIFFGGGPTIPSGAYGDYAKTGYLIMAGFGVDIGKSGLFIEAEIGRGTNNHEAIAGSNDKEKTNVVTAFGALGYSFGAMEKKVRPYLLAGAGLVAHQFRTDAPPPNGEGTESKFGATGAGGVSIKLNEKASFWFEGRYIGSKETSHMAVLLGITINFGN